MARRGAMSNNPEALSPKSEGSSKNNRNKRGISRLARTVVAGLAVSGGSMIMAARSGANELAQQSLTTQQNSFEHAHKSQYSIWSILGGDPLIKGGVHSIAQVGSLIESPLGHRTLSREGLTNQQIAAVEAKAKKGGFHKSTMLFGSVFDAMVFGPNGNQIDWNVRFEDSRYPNGAPAFSEDVKIVKTSKSDQVFKDQAGNITEEIITTDQKVNELNIVIPEKCGNIALNEMNYEHKYHKTIIYPPVTTTTVPPTTTTTTIYHPPTTTTTIYYPPVTTTTVKGVDPGIGG